MSFFEKALLEEQAYAKTDLIMAAVEASREYVREELRPRMYAVCGPDYFMLEAMSTSYVGRAVMDRFGRHVPDFQYRRVAINARNPNSEANQLETEMITYFRETPNSKSWRGLAEIQEEAWYMRFEPVFFEASCLNCHGDPRQAPADLIHTYGDQNGFGHYAGARPIAAAGLFDSSTIELYSVFKERMISGFTEEYVHKLLQKTQGNISLAARLAGLSRPALQKMLRRINIDPQIYRCSHNEESLF